MTTMTSAHVLMKILACSLILRLNQVWFKIYMLTDISIFFAFKIAMNDLRYWIPLEGVLSWVVTAVFRIVVKVVVDL